MEPRARAGKNVGKMNFNSQELSIFLKAHGDSRQPLDETMRVIDELVTEFIQGVSFEAARIARVGGRQKVKYEDFQFAMRKNPSFLGKAAENQELREAIMAQRKAFNVEDELTKEDAPASGVGSGRGRKRKAPSGAADEAKDEGARSKPSPGATAAVDEEELGDADDEDAELLAPPSRRV